MKKPKADLRIDIRSESLPAEWNGRFVLSSRTKKATEFRVREALVRDLIRGKEWDILTALKRRKVKLLAVEEARDAGKLGDLRVSLRPKVEGEAPADEMSLQAQTDSLIQSLKATNKADGTIKQYDLVCRQLIERFGPTRPLSSIRAADLEAWIQEPKSHLKDADGRPRPWSPAKQTLALAVIGKLFNRAIDKEEDAAEEEGREARIKRNPTKKVERAGEMRPRVEFLRPKEWQTLSKVTEGRPVHALVALGCLAGLRISECAHLRVGIDVVLDTDRPHINVQPREGAYPWRVKTKRSIRRVPIGTELHRILTRHVELGYSGARYLIISAGKDRPVNRKQLEGWTASAYKAAGISYGRKRDSLTHHSLRHTFISWLVQADVSLKKIETVAGTSVNMILKVYGHLIDENLESAVAIVNSVAVSTETSTRSTSNAVSL